MSAIDIRHWSFNTNNNTIIDAQEQKKNIGKYFIL